MGSNPTEVKDFILSLVRFLISLLALTLSTGKFMVDLSTIIYTQSSFSDSLFVSPVLHGSTFKKNIESPRLDCKLY